MKNMLKCIVAILFLGSCVQKQDEDIQAKLKAFYTYYITTKDGGEVPMDSMNKYCSKQFLKYAYGDTSLDYDPVIMSPHCDKDWVKTLMISKATPDRQKIYRVSFLKDDKEKLSHNIVVTMGQEIGQWKIDMVRDN